MESTNGQRISLVMISCNDTEALLKAIADANTFLAAVASAYEIIVVDRGNGDASANLLDAAAALNSRVRVIERPGRDSGAALRDGLQAARFDVIACARAGAMAVTELGYLLPMLNDYDVAYSCAAEHGSLARRLFKGGGRAFAALLLGSASAHNCHLTVFRRSLAPSIMPQSDSDFAGTEMLARANLAQLRIAQAGLPNSQRSGNAASLRGSIRWLRDLLRFWWSVLLYPAPTSASIAPRGWFWACLQMLMCVVAPLQLYGLAYPLTEPDEGRYAELSRHMWLSGDWIIPVVNQQPFYDKPPLFYWLVAGSYQIFGPSEWAARLVPALSSLLTIVTVFVFGSRVFGVRTAFIAALSLGLTIGFVQIGRVIVLDSLLTLFITLAMFLGYEAVHGKRVDWRWWLASAFCCGLGVLTKGPIALVLVAPPLTAYVWLNRKARLKLVHWIVYGAVAVSLLAPWFAAVIARDSSFVRHFIVDQHLARFLYKYHEKPVWFYVVVLLVGCLPWSVLLWPFLRFQFSRAPEVRAQRQQALGLFTLWAFWPFLFFSMAHSKLLTYTLPSVPAIFMLVGCLLNYVLFEKSLFGFFQRARLALPCWTAGVLAVIWFGAGIVAVRMRLIDAADLVTRGVIALGCVAALAMWGRRLAPRTAWLSCAVLSGIVLFDWTQQFVPAYAKLHSPTEAVSALVQKGEETVVCYGAEWGSIPFCLKREENIYNLSQKSGEMIETFVADHPHFALVVKHPVDMEVFRSVLPASSEIRTVAQMRDYTVALVRRVGGRLHSSK